MNLQRLENQHGLMFKVVDAKIQVGLIQRLPNKIVKANFSKWKGLSSVDHPLLSRLKFNDFVSVQEAEHIGCT